MGHFGKNTSLIPYKIGSLFQLVFQTQLSHLSCIPLTPCFNFSFFFFFQISSFLFWKIKNSYYKKTTTIPYPQLSYFSHIPLTPHFYFLFFPLSRLICFYLKKKRDLSISFDPFYFQ